MELETGSWKIPDDLRKTVLAYGSSLPEDS